MHGSRLRPAPHRNFGRKLTAPPSANLSLVAVDYESFRAMLNNRRRALKLSFTELDALTGLQSGYTAKLIAEPRVARNYQKCIGPKSMGKLLTALGAQLRIEPVEESQTCSIDSGNFHTYTQVLRERSRRGGLACFARMTDEQKFSFQRAGGLASAAKRRAAKAKKRVTDSPRAALAGPRTRRG